MLIHLGDGNLTDVNNLVLAEKYENGSYKCFQGQERFNILSSHQLKREKDNTSFTAYQVDNACYLRQFDSGDFGEYQACIVNGRTKNGRCGMVCYYGDDSQPTVLPPELMCDGIQDCNNNNTLDTWCSDSDTVRCKSETGEDVTIPEMYVCDGSIHVCNSKTGRESDEDRCGIDRAGGDWQCPFGFLHPSKYCDEFNDCWYSHDEKRCDKSRAELYMRQYEEGRLCEDPRTREVKYLYPEQICGNPTVYTGEFAPEQDQFRPCYNKFDQILCDEAAHQTGHGLRCVLNETLKTYLHSKMNLYFYPKIIDRDVDEPKLISKHLLCDGESDCEDGFDEVCVNPSTHTEPKSQANIRAESEYNKSPQNENSCSIHKHLICDGKVDCLEGEDELESLCDNDDWLKLTECKRRTIQERADREKTRLIHVTWIRDGYNDCANGIDEEERQKECPVRFVDGKEKMRSFENQCEEVYKCLEELKTPESYVEIPEMCSSSLDTCARQNRVCSAAKDKQNIETKPVTRQFIHKADSTSTNALSEIKYLAPCLPGLLEYGQFNCTTGEHHLLGSMGDLREISKSAWVYENKKVFDCAYYFGENFLFLSCNDLCPKLDHDYYWNFYNYLWKQEKPKKCPFKHPEYHDDFSKKIGNTIAQVRLTARQLSHPSYRLRLVALEKTRNSYHIRWFGCDNGHTIPLNEVCDLENDCGDNSDETYCANSINCPISNDSNDDVKTYPRIPFSSISNGKVDCKNTDEKNRYSYNSIVENDECIEGRDNEFYLLGGAGFRFALSFGTLATVINLAVLFKNIRKLQKTATSSVLFGDSIYIFLISIGDFCVGVDLLLLAYHHREYDDFYCRKKYEWFSSLNCNILGVLSTFGSQISLFSMTIMSALRARNLSCSLSFHFTRKLLMVYIILAMAVITVSIAIAVAPLLDMFEDYFINGQVYYGTQDRQIFLYGLQTKRDLISTIDAHYGSSIYKKAQTSGDTVRWSEVRRLFKGMFTNIWSNGQSEVMGIQSAKVGFYGSGPACIFKFFVTKQDPQRVFSIAILSVNLVCFFIITISYIRILQISLMSNKAVGRRNESSLLLQTKVSMIILSDALCWIPFIIFAFLHYQEIENAEKHYVLFSVILLPINSVVNPIIYHYNHNYTKQKFSQLWNLVRNLARGGREHVSGEVATTVTTAASTIATTATSTTATTAASTTATSTTAISPTFILSLSYLWQILRPKVKPSPSTLQVRYKVGNSTVEIADDASVIEESQTQIMEME